MSSRLILLFLLLLGLPAAPRAGQPDYLVAALENFNPNLPPDWAYTVQTTKGGETSVERYDPSLAAESHWTLLRLNNRPATAEESARYASYRIATSRSSHPTFLRSDIDQVTFRLIREDNERAVFAARFREGLADPLLAKLELSLTVAKATARIEAFGLELTEPHSPVLTVKMLSLRVDTTLATTGPNQPALPARTVSRFRGRVFFFKEIEEDVDSTYSDFVHVNLPAAASTSSLP